MKLYNLCKSHCIIQTLRLAGFHASVSRLRNRRRVVFYTIDTASTISVSVCFLQASLITVQPTFIRSGRDVLDLASKQIYIYLMLFFRYHMFSYKLRYIFISVITLLGDVCRVPRFHKLTRTLVSEFRYPFFLSTIRDLYLLTRSKRSFLHFLSWISAFSLLFWVRISPVHLNFWLLFISTSRFDLLDVCSCVPFSQTIFAERLSLMFLSRLLFQVTVSRFWVTDTMSFSKARHSNLNPVYWCPKLVPFGILCWLILLSPS